MGDGTDLSLADLKTSANLFGGVQLLTLSACDMGVGDRAEVAPTHQPWRMTVFIFSANCITV